MVMSIGLKRQPRERKQNVPELHNGDHLSQPEFHRRYEACPEDVKFELIGGVVYMSSPMREAHSDYDVELGFVFGLYRRATPGSKDLHGATIILGASSEPQPDLGLRILPEYGGRTVVNRKGYLRGPAELLGEIAYSTVAIDLHEKKMDYKRAGVNEYLVLCVEEQEIHWFDFRSNTLILPDSKGILRSNAFPGLWIDGPALLAPDSKKIEQALQQGLASPEHAAFIKRLQAAYRKRRNGK
jgi:Uma2 family endonuclease